MSFSSVFLDFPLDYATTYYSYTYFLDSVELSNLKLASVSNINRCS